MTTVVLEVEVPESLAAFRLPDGLQDRLQELLDRQDAGEILTPAERKEAESLVDLAEWLSLLKLRARRIAGETASSP